MLASPVAQALRDRFPHAHLTWAVEAKAREVVEGLPGVDDLLVWEARPSRALGLYHALAEVRRRRFDIALDLQGLAKAGLFLLFSGAERRITGSRAKTLARSSSTEILPEPVPRGHAADTYLGYAAALGAQTRQYRPQLPLREAHRLFADDFIRTRVPDGAPLIGFNLGASKEQKLWSPEHFANVADRLVVRYDAHGVVFAAPWEMDLAQRMVSGSRHRKRLHVAAGKTSLLQLAALAERCTTVITADTGPMHIAAAAGVPVVALFGPSNPRHTGPYGPGHQVVDAVRVLKDEGRPVPRARTHYGQRFGRVDDLSAIEPRHVLEAVDTLWPAAERRLRSGLPEALPERLPEGLLEPCPAVS